MARPKARGTGRRVPVWRSLFKVDVPVAGEFFLMFVFTLVIY